jgi:hypothetical protein
MLFEAVLACLQARLAGSYDALHCCPCGDGDITLANLEGQAMRCMLFMLLWPDEPCVLQYVGTLARFVL